MRILGFEISRRPTLAQRMIAERSIDIRKPNVGTGIANVSAGRKSVETPGFTGFEVFGTISRRKGLASLGLDRKFDLADFARLDFDTLTDLLIDLSPEIAKALWDALLMANSGYETKALNIRENEEGDTINKRGQRIVDGILKQLSEYHGTTGVFFDRVFKTLMARGSYMMELVLDQNGRDFIDIATPDTKTLEFKRVDDPIRGQTWVYGQRINNKFVNFTGEPTIRYVPLHPGADSIEGHGIFTPAFFSAIFLLSVLRDTKRVVEHQGYLRLDVKILFEKLLASMPADIQNDSKKIEEWMDEITTRVQEVYANLEPDETYIHSDTIEVNKPVGAASSDALNAIDALFQAIERMLTRAVKSMPVLMATNQTRSETQANREWDIWSLGIEMLQHLVEAGFEHELELACRAQGVRCRVKHRFAQFRTSEALRDAQVDMLKTQIARMNYDNGYWSQDEAAQYAVNRNTADSEVPRVVVSQQTAEQNAGATNSANENPNPSETKAMDGIEIRQGEAGILSGAPDNQFIEINDET